MSLTLQIVFSLKSMNPLEIWETILKLHPNLKNDNEKCLIYNKKTRFKEVSEFLRTWQKPHLDIEFIDGSSIGFGQVKNWNISVLYLKNCIYNNDVDNWILPFLDTKYFISSRLYNLDYNKWQNAHDILSYQAAGKSHSHLPKKSNNAPPPLEQLVVDTSKNPGRMIFRDGYIEAVGSHMWFGNKFWEATGTDKIKVLSTDWLECKQLDNEVLFIKASDEPFSEENEQADLQNKLRKLLFPKSDG